MSKCPVHTKCYLDVESELANYKLTSQLQAGAFRYCSILGSRRDEEEPVNIRTTDLVEPYGISATNAVFKNSPAYCAGFGWHRVNFLHSTSYDAMLWICDEKC